MNLIHWSPMDDHASAETLVVRAFGSGLDDLIVDFLAPLDIAISEILQKCLSSQCGDAFSGVDISGWTIAKRRQGLLAVAVTTNGPSRTLTVLCSEPDCAVKLDLDVDLTQFRQDWREDKLSMTFETGKAIEIRHPTPGDLSCWANSSDVDATLSGSDLANILLVGDQPLRPGWEDVAQAALSAADPLADLVLRANCPECGAIVTYPLVLELFLLEELSQQSIKLMDEIHLLAMAYHWTEPDILSLPESRRRHYLARIGEAWAA